MAANGAHDDIILRLEGITKDFPGVKALDGVSFDVRRGEVHALVGENGAGKSTLMHILGGVFPPTAGKVFLDGAELKPGSVREAQRRGVRVVYQELSIVPHLSAAENIFANSQPVNALGLVRRKELNRRAADMIALFGEDIDPDIPAVELSIGKRQVLEILKALTFSPRVVLLDEPTSSLSGVETETLFRTIGKLKSGGMSFLFISHHLPEVFEIADRVTVLRDGVCRGTFETADITEDELIRKMVGRSVGDMFGGRAGGGETGRTVLSVEGLSRRGEFEDVSFSIGAGEILGFAGLVGAGRSEVARAIFGVSRPDGGSVAIDGATVRIRHVRDAVGHGVGYLTEDRKLQGLCLGLTVRENLAGPSLSRFATPFGMMNDGLVADFAGRIVDRLNIVTPSVDQLVYHLSGGNQQKVLLGMWMGIEPRVLIVDEPTKGVDVGAKEEIYTHIFEHAARGAAVMLISSDLNEILGMSDRICVMRSGRIVAVVDAAAATEELIISHALGAGEAVQ